MADKPDPGSYFYRGGERIEVEKEEDVFTATVRDDAELERLKSLEGVTAADKLQSGVVRVRVSAPQRDAAMERIRSREMAGVCHHAYRPKDSTSTRYYITDRLVVRFGPDVSDETVSSILAEAGVRLVKEYRGRPGTYLVQVTSDSGQNPIKVANALAERDEVEWAEPNLVNRYQVSHTPSDTHFARQWHLKAWNAPDLVADADVRASEAWDITRGSRDVVIAVLDDGFDITHPDLSGDGKVVHPKDYVEGDVEPLPVTEHGDYHGTPCAGVALAEENGTGVVGIAPGCAFMPVRWDIGGTSDDLIWEILDFAGERADVISCSWGPPPVNAPLSQLLKDKYHDLATTGGLRKKGCVICFAACNHNAPLYHPNHPGCVWRHPVYGLQETKGRICNGEATHPDVIAVSASTSLNRKAAYSNWGAEVSVCAPSDNGHPLDPWAYVPGRGIWTIDNEQYGTDFTEGSQFTGSFGGTSSATPLVAGVAALVISANPLLTAAEVKQILQDTADRIEDHEPDPVLGNTKGTYDGAGHSEWFGFGKVNAARAVQEAHRLYAEATQTRELAMQAADAGHLEGANDEQHFKVRVGAKLVVALDGPDGPDFDVYVKRDAKPTTQEFDARGYSARADERVEIDAPEPGDYYIMVRSYNGSGDYRVSVELE